jgi:hypothetical protein
MHQSARTDLCRGRDVTRVPTATESRSLEKERTVLGGTRLADSDDAIYIKLADAAGSSTANSQHRSDGKSLQFITFGLRGPK